MNSHVFSVRRKEHQIFWAVVLFIMVDVMYHFKRFKNSTYFLFNYIAMFKVIIVFGKRMIRQIKLPISSSQNPPAFPPRIFYTVLSFVPFYES